MPIRFILRVSRRTVRAVLLTVLVLVLAFFALTRTQVGREGLRAELERQFNGRFAGELHIGQLKGNLVYDLYAKDVRLLDPTGRVVVSIDSVVARPHWSDLLRRRLSVRRLTLVRPRLYLFRQANSAWNLAETLREVTPDTTGPSRPLAFSTADVRVVEGTVMTRNAGNLPGLVEHGQVFDFTNAELRQIDADATVEWLPGQKLIDLLAFSAVLSSEDVAIETLQGQLLLDPARAVLNRFILEAGATRLELSGAYTPDEADESIGAASLSLDVAPSQLDHETLRRVFPALPLSDQTAVTLQVNGPLSALVLEEITVARGDTRLSGAGTLLGLPDSLNFELAFPENRFTTADVRAVLPAADVPDLDHLGLLEADLEGSGVYHLGAQPGDPLLRVAATLDLTGAAGAVRGTLGAVQRSQRPVRVTADLQTQGLNLGAITRNPALDSFLNGRFTVDGRAPTLAAASGTGQATLRRSSFSERWIDTLHVEVRGDSGLFNAYAYLEQLGGSLQARAALDLTSTVPSYRLDAHTQDFDLGGVLKKETLETQLDSYVELTGSGFSWESLQGRASVTFDSSRVRSGPIERVIPPHRSVIALTQQPASGMRLSLGGDLAAVTLQGTLQPDVLVPFAALWTHVFAEGIRDVADKPYPRARPVLRDTLRAGPPPSDLERRTSQLLTAARRAQAEVVVDSAITLTADVRLLRGDVLSALLPMLPPVASDAHLRATLLAGIDRLTLDGTVRGDSLRLGDVRAGPVQMSFAVAARRDTSFEQGLTLRLRAEADSLALGSQRFRAPQLALDYRNREGRLRLDAAERGQTGPFRLEASLDVLQDRNRLTLRNLYVAAEGYTWVNAEEDPIDLYADAAVIRGLLLENRGAGSAAVQRIALQGTLSEAPTDTVFVTADDIDVRQLATVMGMERKIGGHLNGRIALTGALGQPELTGRLEVATLSFDDRLLGRLDATSRYVPGSPDVALDLIISPAPEDTNLTYLPGTRIKPVVEVTELRLGGTFRLPQANRVLAQADPGHLMLDLRVDRANAFFFEFLFPDLVDNVDGYFAGEGSVRGTFRKPLFGARLRLRDGHFEVPKFGLAYDIEGPVRVDAEGIKLDTLQLTDAGGGRAAVAGGILFNDYRFFSFDLQAQLDELQVVNNPTARNLAFYGQMWASGNATFTGPIYNTFLRSTDLVTTPQSEVFIPLTEGDFSTDPGFILFADSTGNVPDLTERKNLISGRPAGERPLLDGLEMDLNIFAPQGSTVHLVIDPLVDVGISAVGNGRSLLKRSEGEFATFGTLEVDGGDYMFTAGEVFVRRFLIDDGGSITWDGDPTNSSLDIHASYRTRASAAGLPGSLANNSQSLIPVIVKLHITGRVAAPLVDLSLAIDSNQRSGINDYQGWEAILNEPERATEYATSVLLTNSFLLTTSLASGSDSDFRSTRNQFAFNSLSQLVASQINRYLSQALPNVDFNFGVQSSENAQDLDVTYGVALRLMDERLIIRGQGVYQGGRSVDNASSQQILEGEFVVEVRLSTTVSVEVFYRRQGDALAENVLTTNTAGAGLSYQTQFSTWRRLFSRLFGWLIPDKKEDPDAADEPVATGLGQ